MENKELALELTKLYVEHMNRRIDQKAGQSHISEKHIATAFQYFYETATFERYLLSDKTENPKNE